MKLGENALLEVVEILLKGLTESKDVSDLLKDVDLVEKADGRLHLSDRYLANRGRLIPEN